jgi:hypothetical protein
MTTLSIGDVGGLRGRCPRCDGPMIVKPSAPVSPHDDFPHVVGLALRWHCARCGYREGLAERRGLDLVEYLGPAGDGGAVELSFAVGSPGPVDAGLARRLATSSIVVGAAGLGMREEGSP